MNENFSKGIKNILKFARSEAKRLESSIVTPEHLLLGIIKDKEGIFGDKLSTLKDKLRGMTNPLKIMDKLDELEFGKVEEEGEECEGVVSDGELCLAVCC